MKYKLYCVGLDSFNDIEIECSDKLELGHYFRAAIIQEHYKEVRVVKCE